MQKVTVFIACIFIIPVLLVAQVQHQFNVSIQVNGTLPNEVNISNCIILFNHEQDTLMATYTIGEIFISNSNKLQVLSQNFQDSIISMEFLFDEDLTGLKKKYAIRIKARNLFQRYCVLKFTDIKSLRSRKHLRRDYFADYSSPLETGTSPRLR